MGHILFELNYKYHIFVFFENKCNARSRSSSANRLAIKLRELMNVYYQNLFYTQNLQKQAYNKGVKSCSYALDEQIWLNSKYIMTKRNQKLEAKFIRLFQSLHLVEKQAYKLELPTKQRIHDVFHVLVLKQDTKRKKQINKFIPKFEVGNNKEYEIKVIQDRVVYAKKADGHFLGLYYLVI